LPEFKSDLLITGGMKKADAAVFKLSDGNYGIFSVDVLAPIVDDPEVFGRIVFANCISDVCAMGGKPLVGLNVAMFTGKADTKELSKILKGAAKAALENGVVIAGGHTAKDEEIKFGIAVYGQANPNEIMLGNMAKEGDLIVLTKPIGIGIQFAAYKNGACDFREAIDSMLQVNIKASEILVRHGCKCCTDVTGFGLAATLLEVLEESKKSAVIRIEGVPLLSGVDELANNYACPVLKHNVDKTDGKLTLSPSLDPKWLNILCDAQTSGGLLAFISKEKVDACLVSLREAGYTSASIVGEIAGGASGVISAV